MRGWSPEPPNTSRSDASKMPYTKSWPAWNASWNRARRCSMTTCSDGSSWAHGIQRRSSGRLRSIAALRSGASRGSQHRSTRRRVSIRADGIFIFFGSSALASSGAEDAIQCCGKRLLLTRAVRPRAARFYTGAPDRVHEVPDGEALAHVLLGILLTARVQHDDPLFHENRGERDVGGDGDVARPSILRDMTIGNVRTALHPHRADVRAVERRR